MFNYGAKIQRLLATAKSLEDQGNAEAAASYYAKAEHMMREYRVAEEEALAQDVAAALPIKHKIVLITHQADVLGHYYVSAFRRITEHTGVRFTLDWDRQEDGTYHRIAWVVGYEGDVRYAEYLWTAAYLMFVTRIDPRWDDALPEAENIWRLRNAGIERRKIADRAWGNGYEAKARTKVQRIYLKECARRGEEARATGLSHQTKVYREVYAQSFVTTLGRRLQEAREATDSVAGGLVLHGRADRVDEAFYGHFPHLRPKPAPEPTVVVVDTEGTAEAECAKCKRAKSGHCRDHRPLVWTQADERRWQRYNGSASARAGQAAGRAAAEGVAIRQTDRATRLDRSGGAIEG